MAGGDAEVGGKDADGRQCRAGREGAGPDARLHAGGNLGGASPLDLITYWHSYRIVLERKADGKP